MRIDQLTFGRFLAAISIVVFHYGLNVYPFNDPAVAGIFSQAHLGVSYFFVLSGFIMIVAYGRRDHVDVADYYRNRFARVYPLMAFSIVMFAIASSLIGPVKYDEIFLNLSTLQSWVPGMALCGNYPLWSLTVEFFFFACFPFLFNYFYKRLPLIKVAEIIFVFWCFSMFVQNYLIRSPFYQGFPSPSHDIIFYMPLMHLNQFMVGNLAGLVFIRQKTHAKGQYDIIVLLTLIIIYIIFKNHLGIDYHDGFLAAVFAPFILFQAKNTGIISRIFSLKPLVFLGEISFGIYVLQAPVFAMMNYLNAKYNFLQDPAQVFYLNTFVLIAFSAVCHYLIELPARNRLKSIRLKKINIKVTVD